MYVQLRIYATHDLDLLAYMKIPFMKLDDIIHACVCAYVRGENVNIPYSKIDADTITLKDKRICITFDDEKDADVVAYLQNIRYGYQNTVIKYITRLFLPMDELVSLFEGDPEAVPQITKPTPNQIVEPKPKPKIKKKPVRAPVVPVVSPIVSNTASDSSEETDIGSEPDAAAEDNDVFDIFDSMIDDNF